MLNMVSGWERRAFFAEVVIVLVELYFQAVASIVAAEIVFRSDSRGQARLTGASFLLIDAGESRGKPREHR